MTSDLPAARGSVSASEDADGTTSPHADGPLGGPAAHGAPDLPDDLPAPVVAEVRELERPAEHQEPYRTLAVVAVAAGLLLVPALSLLGHNRLAVLWLAVGVFWLAMVRLRRPTGTWIAARGRVFDVVVGVLLAFGLGALSYYAVLPHV